MTHGPLVSLTCPLSRFPGWSPSSVETLKEPFPRSVPKNLFLSVLFQLRVNSKTAYTHCLYVTTEAEFWKVPKAHGEAP